MKNLKAALLTNGVSDIAGAATFYAMYRFLDQFALFDSVKGHIWIPILCTLLLLAIEDIKTIVMFNKVQTD